MTETLKPWYAVATPHEDIREGRLAEAVFAANLWALVQGTVPEVYLNTGRVLPEDVPEDWSVYGSGSGRGCARRAGFQPAFLRPHHQPSNRLRRQDAHTRDWKLVSTLLGERPTLRAEGKRTAYRETQATLGFSEES